MSNYYDVNDVYRTQNMNPVFVLEGLAVGVGFGAIGKSPSATFESAR